MGFVQIALDFGFPPVPETENVREEKSTPVNGNGSLHNGEGKTPPAPVAGFRKLTPPPPDKILAEGLTATPAPAPLTELSPTEQESPSEEVVTTETTIPGKDIEKETEETTISEKDIEDIEEEDTVEVNDAAPGEWAGEEPIVSHMNEAQENTFLTESTEEEHRPGAENNTVPLPEETPAPSIVFFQEEPAQETEEETLIEFELEPDVNEEDMAIEKQVSYAYFRKADENDDEEVFEIPMFSRATPDTDAKPVVIVRVKEKKEAAAQNKNKRGRKSIREMMAEAEMVEIPEDELLFKKQYYGIGEVARMFGVNTSLIRFWETEFDIIRPKKNRKGDRLFRPIDIKNLHLIHNLLRLKKFTIEGAKDFLKNNRKKAEKNFEIEQSLKRIRGFLLQMKADLGVE